MSNAHPAPQLGTSDEFLTVTITLVLERVRADAALHDALHAAANVDGCISAEADSHPRRLNEQEWEATDAVVNFLATFNSDDS